MNQQHPDPASPASNLSFQVDSIPQERLASWGEGCACHEQLYVKKHGHLMNEDQRRQLMETHFGKGRRACPMAGKRADDLALGHFGKVLDDCWAIVDEALKKQNWKTLH